MIPSLSIGPRTLLNDCNHSATAIFWRSAISVLSFYRLYFGGYSIFMIARSIDLAPLPSDNKSTMGPGFAVVGTPGSPSDVARTKVLLPRL